MGELMGLSGRQDWRIEARLSEVSDREPSKEELLALALAQRQDLEAARQEVGILKKELGLRRLDPWNGVRVGVDTEKETDSNRLTGPTWDLELPIYDLGQAPVVLIQAKTRQAEHRVLAAENRIKAEVERAWTRFMAARSAAETYRASLVPMHQRIVELTQEQYNYMLHGVYALLAAKESEIGTRHDGLMALKDYWTLRSELERVTGSRLPEGELVPQSSNSPVQTPSNAPSSPQSQQHSHHHGGNHE